MTEYFEVTDRDGPARIGELRLTEPVVTPTLVTETGDPPATFPDEPAADLNTLGADGDTLGANADPPDSDTHPDERAILRDTGSRWTSQRPRPTGDPNALTIVPHRAFPAGTREEVIAAFAPPMPAIDGPSAAVVSTDAITTPDDASDRTPDENAASEYATDEGTPDAYVVSDARAIVDHASRFVDRLTTTRERVAPDTAVYLPGVATPRNIATLVYAGVDLLDATRARIAGSQGMYLTTDDERFLEDLDELPCVCPACQTEPASFDREDCERHNVAALAAELRRVRRRIREGRLRDYLTAQARMDQTLTAIVRELDEEYGYLERRTPVVRSSEIAAVSDDTLRRVEIQRYAERVTTRYENRFDVPCVLVPCSARKPYSESQSHEQFHRAIDYRAHTVSMTSPIGVVPQELELTYPAQQYDTVVTGRWSETERAFVTDVLTAYLERTNYPRVIAHVPLGGYRDICERAAERTDTRMEFTVTDHPTTDESLAALSETLAGTERYGKRKRQHNTVRAIADWMLGPGAGDELFEELRTTSRYPKLQVRDANDEQLATMVPQYGVLSFTLAGARRWVASDAPTKRVQIDSFVPHGSVLAPGVVEADPEIRVGDEVVIEGPKAFAVGRAQMFGREMADSTRGVAVSVRHVEER